MGRAGSLLEAIDVYRTDLQDHPRNIWSLRGLQIAYGSLRLIGLANTTDSATQTKEQIITAAVGGMKEKENDALLVDIEVLKGIERDAFAPTDYDYLKITGSCCELSLC